MHTDPTAYILAASLLGGCVGFFGCALLVSRRMRRAHTDAWNEARKYYQDLYTQP